MASQAQIGQLVVELLLADSQFRKQLDSAATQLQKFATGVTAALTKKTNATMIPVAQVQQQLGTALTQVRSFAASAEQALVPKKIVPIIPAPSAFKSQIDETLTQLRGFSVAAQTALLPKTPAASPVVLSTAQVQATVDTALKSVQGLKVAADATLKPRAGEILLQNSQLKKQLDGAVANVATLGTAINKSLTPSPAALGSLRALSTSVTQAVKPPSGDVLFSGSKFKSQIDSTLSNLKGLSTAAGASLKPHTGADILFSGEQLKTQFKTATAGVNALAKNVDTTIKNIGRSGGGVGALPDPNVGFASAMASVEQIVVRAFQAMTLAATAFGVAVVKVGSDFETAMATLGAIAEEQPGSAGFEALQKQALLLGSTTMFSAKQAAEGLTELKKAGLDVQQSIDASSSVIQLAGAHTLDLGRASSIVAATLTQFQIPAKDSARVVDVLSTAANASLASVDSLGQALKFAAPVAYGFGNSLEETTTVIAAFTNLGIDAGLAGRAMRSGLSALTTGTEEQIDALKKYDLTLKDVNPENIKLIDLIQLMADKNITMTDSLHLFGTESGGAFASLAKGVRDGTVDLRALEAQLKTSAGSTEKIYGTMSDTLGSQTKITFNKLQNLMIGAFEDVKEPLKEVVAGVGDLVTVAGGLIKDELPNLKNEFSEIAVIVTTFLREDGPATVKAILGVTEGIVTLIGVLTEALSLAGRLANALYDVSIFKGIKAAIDDSVDGGASAGLASGDTGGAGGTTVGGTDKPILDNARAYIELQNEADALQKKIEDNNYTLEEQAGSTRRNDRERLDSLNAQTAALEVQLKVMKEQSRLDTVKAGLLPENQAALMALPGMDQSETRTTTKPDSGGEADAKAKREAEKRLKEAQSTFDALRKMAQSAAAEVAKATMSPFELLVFDTNAAETELRDAYGKAIDAAQKAGLGTVAIEEEKARAIAALDERFALAHDKLVEEQAQRSASANVDIQDTTLSAYEAGLNAREKIAQAAALADAHANIDQQKNAIALAEKLTSLTDGQVEDRLDAERAAAATSEQIEAERIAKVLAANRELAETLAKEQENIWNARVGVMQALLDGDIAARRDHSTTALDIDRQLAIDKIALAVETKAKIDAINASDVAPEVKRAQVEVVVAGAEAAGAQLEASAKDDKKHNNDPLEDQAGFLGDAFDLLEKFGAMSEDQEKKWLKGIILVEQAYAKVAGAVSGVVDTIQAGLDKTMDLVETLTGFSTSLSDMISIAATSEGGTSYTAANEETGAVANTTAYASGSAMAATNAVDSKVDAALDFATSLASNIGLVVTSIVERLPEIMEAAANAIGPVIDAIMDNVDDIVIAIGDGLGTMVEVLVAKLPDLIQKLTDNFAAMLVPLIDAVADIAVALIKQLPKLVESLLQQLPTIISALVAGIADVITAVIKAIPGIVIAIVDAVPAIAVALVEAIPVLITAVLEGLFGKGGLIDRIPDIIEALLTAIPALVFGVVKALPQITAAVIKALPMIVTSLLEMILIEIPVMLGEFFLQFWKGIGEGILDVLGQIGDFFQGIWDGFELVFKNIGEALLETITLGLAKTGFDKGDFTGDKAEAATAGIEANTSISDEKKEKLLQEIKDAEAAQEELDSHTTGWKILHSNQVLALKAIIAEGEKVAEEYASYDEGANVLPFDQTARVHKNEAVIPADENPYRKGTKSGIVRGGLWSAVAQAVLGFVPDATALAADGNTGSQSRSQGVGDKRVNVMGSFLRGINMVPTTMPITAHAGELIVPAELNPFTPSGSARAKSGSKSSGALGALGGGSGDTHLEVAIDGKVVDKVIVRGTKRGTMAATSKMMRKSSGTKLGVSTKKSSRG